jgi:hypothetical protein
MLDPNLKFLNSDQVLDQKDNQHSTSFQLNYVATASSSGNSNATGTGF